MEERMKESKRHPFQREGNKGRKEGRKRKLSYIAGLLVLLSVHVSDRKNIPDALPTHGF